MLQTRAEAAGLVLSLQRSALGRGLAWYAVAAMAAMALMFALLLFIAFGMPAEYRATALGLATLALFGATAYCVVRARQELTRDSALLADFATGLRLDLAMVNLALKDPATNGEQESEARERATDEVHDPAEERSAVLRAATPAATEMEHPSAPITPPDEMTHAPLPPMREAPETRSHGTA